MSQNAWLTTGGELCHQLGEEYIKTLNRANFLLSLACRCRPFLTLQPSSKMLLSAGLALTLTVLSDLPGALSTLGPITTFNIVNEHIAPDGFNRSYV